MRDMERNSLTCMRELLLLAQERENSARERIPFTSKRWRQFQLLLSYPCLMGDVENTQQQHRGPTRIHFTLRKSLSKFDVTQSAVQLLNTSEL